MLPAVFRSRRRKASGMMEDLTLCFDGLADPRVTGQCDQIAGDRQAAMAVGINIDRHFGLVWAIAGIVPVCAGVLWVLVAGGGFGLALVGLKVFPIVVVAGLDSVPGTIVAAILIGTVESLGAAYLDPQLGGGFGAMTSYLLLLATLVVRPYGLFGRPPAERV